MPYPRQSPLPLIPLWRRLLATPDRVLVDAGADGELLVAQIRLLVTGALLLLPLNTLIQSPGLAENFVGLGSTLAAVGLAVIVYQLVRRGHYPPWLGFATAAMDVTLVSAPLAIFLALDTPHTAVNSKVVYEAYFLALGATCLRYDARICVVAAALAVLQYFAIVVVAATHWDLNSPLYAPFPYGMFDWGAQVSRVILLGIGGLLSTLIVLRTQRLRELSTSDRLTGLLNRGHFDDVLADELSRAERHGHSLAIAMLDVDHFKRFNDTHGHAAGDAALRAIADLFRRTMRQSDAVARYGGEEFVAFLPETTAPAAVAKFDELRRTMSQLEIAMPRRTGGGGLHLTISAGVSSWPADGTTADELIERADARLFEAKQLGRNRVVGPEGEAQARAG